MEARVAVLIPQFSIRTLLIVTAICAAFFSVVGLAVRGSPWAMGVRFGHSLVSRGFMVREDEDTARRGARQDQLPVARP